MDCLGRQDLPKIPAEFIEPYIVQYISLEIENIATGHRTPQKALENLKALDLFIDRFCGIHSVYAMNNFIDMFREMSDETIIEIAKASLNKVV